MASNSISMIGTSSIIMNHSDVETSFLGLFPLSTHRALNPILMNHNNNITTGTFDDYGATAGSSIGYEFSSFPYEALISAIAICFFRSTVYLHPYEPRIIRWLFSILLAALAYTRKSYELIIAVELFSYVLSWVLNRIQNKIRELKRRNSSSSSNGTNSSLGSSITLESLLLIVAGAGTSFLLAHMITSDQLMIVLEHYTPQFIRRVMFYLFPIQEIQSAYDLLYEFMGAKHSNELDYMINHLFFVTFHIQCGMGFLGIDFLRQEQSRKNSLIRLDVAGKEDVDDQEDNVTKNGGVDNTTTTTKNQSTMCEKETPKSQQQEKEEIKRNELLLKRAKRFQKGAATFIFSIAMPYMVQIIIYGNINQYAFTCVNDEFHRIVRIDRLFEHNNHLIAMSNETPLASSSYAVSMNNIVNTVYDLFNRKLFSLPKICLLPTVMSRQPMLMIQVFPFIFISDYMKAIVVSYMTTQMERLQTEIKNLSGVRTKLESFDIKNAELIQRSATSNSKVRQFTHQRWTTLTRQVQSRMVVSDIIRRSKEFFQFLQRNFVFAILIDCALAQLIAVGKIITAEVFVFSRAIEDTVDLILMKSRSEAEIARMVTEINKLKELVNIWDNSRKLLSTNDMNNKLHCRIQDSTTLSTTSDHHHQRHLKKSLTIRNLHYTRGTASARADHLELCPGVYALTGANGSGKSTLFRIIMSCDTNDKVTDLPSSINLLTPSAPLMEEDDMLREVACLRDDDQDEDGNNESCDAAVTDQGTVDTADVMNKHHHIPKLSIVMPSSIVVEISQNFYWPLYAKPIDWIYEDHISLSLSSTDLKKITRKVAEELHSLEFFQKAQVVASDTSDIVANTTNDDQASSSKQTSDALSAEASIQKIMSELLEEKEDWFSELSGGQKSKVELVRTVFIRDLCPDVLLIDETMAPLDPASKEVVMAKLKLFCHSSIIIVIYHTDVGLGKEVEGGKTIDCVPSNGFFDKNIHLDKGLIHIREVC